MKAVYKQHGNVYAGYLRDNLPHLYSQGVWLFGDWDKALSAAGFTPEKMRLWAFWDQAKLISQIRALRDKHLPLYAKYVLDNHKKLFSAARRQFESWEKALIAAGCVFRTKSATHSDANRPPVPKQTGHGYGANRPPLGDRLN